MKGEIGQMAEKRAGIARADGPKVPERTCDNPNCDAVVKWPEQAQRPNYYHDRDCRRAARREAAKLEAEIQELTELQDQPGLSDRQRRRVHRDLQNAVWALGPYPPSARRLPLP